MINLNDILESDQLDHQLVLPDCNFAQRNKEKFEKLDKRIYPHPAPYSLQLSIHFPFPLCPDRQSQSGKPKIETIDRGCLDEGNFPYSDSSFFCLRSP